MPMKIVILEDNAERCEAMRACLMDRFTQFEARFFATSVETIEYLRANLSDTLVVSLDHDLELTLNAEGRWIDPGTGREVADYLATCAAVCTVIVHTTNAPAGRGMELMLQDAGWETQRVIPHDDLAWVAEDWFPVLRRAIVGPVGAALSGKVVLPIS